MQKTHLRYQAEGLTGVSERQLCPLATRKGSLADRKEMRQNRPSSYHFDKYLKGDLPFQNRSVAAVFLTVWIHC